MTTLFDIIKAKNPDFSDTDKVQLSKRLLLLFQLSVLQENVCKDIERELGGTECTASASSTTMRGLRR